MKVDYKQDYFGPGTKFQDLTIKFIHVASGETVEFLPFITAFEDNFEQIWNPTEVFGRMDAIKSFKRTKRQITLSWDVPSSNWQEAIENHKKCQKFLKMNYPAYQYTRANVKIDSSASDNEIVKQIQSSNFTSPTTTANELVNKIKKINSIFEPNNNLKPVAIMTSPPIIGIQYGNFIYDPSGDEIETSYLYGTIQGSSFKPDIEMGFWTINRIGREAMPDEAYANGLIAKVFSFSISFEVIHTSPLGYSYSDRTPDNKLIPRSEFPGQELENAYSRKTAETTSTTADDNGSKQEK